MTVKKYIKYLLSIENYSFSIDEIVRQTDRSETALKFELSRLVQKKEIVNLRKGFYLIIPPRYSIQGHLPIQLYIDKLFLYLDRNYYLGFYSAAKYYGASHQQTQREYVVTELPKMVSIDKKTIDIRFFTTSNWPSKNILKRRSDAGDFRISSPALTAIDLIHFQTKLGGTNRILSIIEELSEVITVKDLLELLEWYPFKSSLQRFGFLLEEVGAETDLIEAVFENISRSKIFPVLLSPKANEKSGAVDNPWKIDVNVKLENDL